MKTNINSEGHRNISLNWVGLVNSRLSVVRNFYAFWKNLTTANPTKVIYTKYATQLLTFFYALSYPLSPGNLPIGFLQNMRLPLNQRAPVVFFTSGHHGKCHSHVKRKMLQYYTDNHEWITTFFTRRPLYTGDILHIIQIYAIVKF